jgi:mycothiol synthase
VGGHRVETPARLTREDRDAVLDLVDRATPADGAPPISEHVLMKLRKGLEPHAKHVLVRAGDELVGYAAVLAERSGPTAEVALTDNDATAALVEAVAEAAGPDVRIWARGQNTSLADRLRALGFGPVRTLLQMRMPLTDPVPDPAWPGDVTVRTFVPGRDEDAWLAVNNAAFAGHPDQSGWTREDIEQREREPWFDPDGFFLAEASDELLGFHWTKVHAPKRPGAEPVGEVYVVGVAPQAQGRKLGSALTLVGLQHLQRLGLPAVKLYVESDNAPARALYERLGFTVSSADTTFERGKGSD